MNPDTLRSRADTASKMKQDEMKEREKQAAQQRKIEAERCKRDWPPFIAQKINEAADNGEYKYEFDAGTEFPDQELREHVFDHFRELNPRVVMRERTEIGDHDMVYVFVFSW